MDWGGNYAIAPSDWRHRPLRHFAFSHGRVLCGLSILRSRIVSGIVKSRKQLMNVLNPNKRSDLSASSNLDYGGCNQDSKRQRGRIACLSSSSDVHLSGMRIGRLHRPRLVCLLRLRCYCATPNCCHLSSRVVPILSHAGVQPCLLCASELKASASPTCRW